MKVEYDGLSRIAKIIYSGGKEVSFAYDLNDNRIQMIDDHGTTNYSYDALNRLVSVLYPGTLPLQYDYDPSNHITRMKYPDGQEVFYTYDFEGHLKKVRSKEGFTSFFYNNLSKTLSKVVFPNGIATEYEYDLSRRVTEVIHKNSKGKILLSFHYKYDANDNCCFKEEISEKERTTVEYTYDKLNRLTQVSYSNGEFETYTYDGFGNRKTKETSKGLEIYEYDTNNLLRKKGDTKFFYDEAGNLQRKEKKGDIWKYFYDENDLLTQVKSNDHLIEFEYDGDGKRIAKIIDGLKTYYINDAAFPISQVLMEVNEKQEPQASYIYAERRLSYTLSNMQSGFYLYDHPAKNVAAVIGKRDHSLTCYSYDGFGNLQHHQKGISNPFQYAGEQKDEETGLIYLRNRYYDPELGRFITPDHKRGDLLKPQSWNPYVYVLNNPVNLVDPLGLDWVTAVAYPPGTMTSEGKSSVGHAFIVLKRTDGQETPLGKYPTADFFKRDIRRTDKIYLGSVTHTWEISPETYDAIEANFGKKGFYLLAKNNCCDATIQAIQKYVDPSFKNAKQLGVNNPTSLMEIISEKNGQKSDYIDKLNTAKAAIWENYENDFIAPTSNGIQHFWKHFLGVPDRGGVSLNKTADLAVNLSEIMGAAFDEQSGQLILIGKRNYSLPQFNSDDFAVAVRSVFGLGGIPSQDPGISMDPYPLTHPKQMNVRYIGETSNTEFGRILFESDKLLKCLSLGKDNVTGKKMKAHVPGYKSLSERYEKTRHPPKGNSYTRLWFVPEEIRVVQSEDKTSMQFETVKMKALSEAVHHHKKMNDSAAESFASHLTCYYDDYAKEFPILNELKRLSQITGVVKWIKDNQIPLDLSFFKQYQPKHVLTPTKTKLIAASWGENRQHFIFGGVSYQLNGSNFFQKNISGIEKIKEATLDSRPSDSEFIWDFSENGSPYCAVAQTLYRTPKTGNVKKNFIDMSFPVQGNNPLVLMRTYDSFQDKTSGFGMGWDLVPSTLRFSDEKKLLNHSNQTVPGYLSILVKDEGMEHLYKVVQLDAEACPVYIASEGSDVLKANKDGGFILFKEKKGSVWFDSEGKLKRVVDKEGVFIDYLYEGSRLISITHQSGQEIRLKYDQGRICQAEGLDGKVIDYFYDDKGQLQSVSNESKMLSSFSYDDENRLNSIKNSHGKVVMSALYDLYGRAEVLEENLITSQQHFNLAEKSMKIVDSQEVVTTKLFDESLRLKEISDSLNRKTEISYKRHFFAPEIVKDSLGHETKYEYNARGNLIAIYRPDKSTKQFWYDNFGYLIVTKDGNGFYAVNNYDDKGRIVFRAFPCSVLFNAEGNISYSYPAGYVTTYEYEGTSSSPSVITYPGGKKELNCYNEDGQITFTAFSDGYCLKRDYESHRLKKIYDESGLYIQYDYHQDVITSITTANSQVNYEKRGNTLISIDGNGNRMSFIFDELDRLSQIIDAEGGITTHEYNGLNQLKRIIFPNGSNREFDYDKLQQPTEEKIVLEQFREIRLSA